MLRSFLFFLTIFSSSLTVITIFPGTPHASPVKDNIPQTEQTKPQAAPAKDNVQQIEQLIKTPSKKEVTSPYANMTQAQINQVKRYDCRLRHRLISHDYKKEAKKIASSAKTIKKDTSKLQEKQ